MRWDFGCLARGFVSFLAVSSHCLNGPLKSKVSGTAVDVGSGWRLSNSQSIAYKLIIISLQSRAFGSLCSIGSEVQEVLHAPSVISPECHTYWPCGEMGQL